MTLICATLICSSLYASEITNTSISVSEKPSNKQRQKFDVLFHDALKLKIQGDFDGAIDLFMAALDIWPDHTTVMYELSGLYLYNNKLSEALFYSKKVALIDETNVWFQLLYIDCLLETGSLKEAIPVYKKLIKIQPTNKELYFELSNLYIRLNKISEAAVINEQLLENIGFDDDVAIRLAKIYEKTNKLDKAIEQMKKAVVMKPSKWMYGIHLAKLYTKNEENGKAELLYDSLANHNYFDPELNLELAKYYRGRKENEKSFSELTKAFSSSQLSIDKKIHILLSYYDLTERFHSLKPQADSLCKILITINNEDAKSFAMYGDFLYRDSKMKEAGTMYRKALDYDKSNYVVWSQLFEIDAKLNNYIALDSISEAAMELFPNQPLSYLYNGIANTKSKNYNKAVNSFVSGKGFVIDNNSLLSQFNELLGDTYSEMSEYSLSNKAFDRALELTPSNSSVLNNYAYRLALRNSNLQSARKMAVRANDLSPNNATYQGTYAWVLFKLGEYMEAKNWIEKAIENARTEDAVLFEHYGDILFKLGYFEEALINWKKAKSLGGDSVGLLDKIKTQQLEDE